MVAIHPDSGHWEAAPSLTDAVRRLRQREPEGLLFTRRIGPPTSSDLRLAARIARK